MTDAVIVFDASGSMAATDFPDGAPSRMDRARRSLGLILHGLPASRRVGLVTYGPGERADACQNATLALPPQQNFADPIMSEVDRLRPAGRTPLTSGVRIASDVLGPGGGAVVLLTDGQETCHGDPCALARRLHAAKPHVQVHVIGYKLQDANGLGAASGAECLATETDGLSLTANTADELISALQQTLGCQTLASRD